MYKHIHFEIEGLPPGTMQHNGRLANPRDSITREMAKITSKQAKQRTDDDLLELIRLEWYGSLYLNSENRIIWPGDNIEGMFCNAAKKKRRKPDFRAGFICPEDPLLLYDGPDDIDKLWEAGTFVDVRGARPAGRGTVQRARPIFYPWALKFTVGYLPDTLNAETVIEVLEIASVKEGLSDFRPKFGRFVIKAIHKE